MYKENITAVPPATLQNPQRQTPEALAEDMVMLEVKHYDFEGTSKTGHIIVHQLAMADVSMFFKTAYMLHFPIHSIIPVSEFDWDDERSCLANNSSGHNMRHLDDGRVSKHGIGCAFDINPRQNPCYVLEEDSLCLKRVIPWDGTHVPGSKGTLMKGHPLVNLMIERGWSWGGNWTFPVDYQHFQIVPPALALYVS